MTCTTAVFSLMLGATALSCAALYFFYKNIVEGFKLKINAFNKALSSLENDKFTLKAKSETHYLESVNQTVEIEKLNEEILTLRNALVRLENDNRLLMREYATLENQRTVINVQRAPYTGQVANYNGQRTTENGQLSIS
jgi:predicted  nucleic acid-binding Zn-ribbon protein